MPTTATTPAPTERTALQQALDLMESLVFDDLQPGDQLPSEGAIAEQLGISRLTVREGVKQLSARGLVETHNGRRPIVALPNGRSVGDYFRTTIRRDPATLLELLEVRLALETHNASLAAANAGDESIRAMRRAVEDMQGGVQDSEMFNEADMRFHELLAAATGNRMLSTLIEELSSCLRTSRIRSVAGHRQRGRELAEVVLQHTAILESIVAHDPAGAAEAMRQHLSYTRRDLTAGLRD